MAYYDDKIKAEYDNFVSEQADLDPLPNVLVSNMVWKASLDSLLFLEV